MKKLIIIFATMLLVSCSTKKKITHIERTDSVSTEVDSSAYIYKEIIRDTTIYLPSDSAYIEALLECDSLGEVHIKEIFDLRSGKNITPSIKIVENVIRVGCTTEDSVAISIYWKDVYEKQYNEYIANSKVDKEVSDEKIVVRTPWFIRLWWLWAILAVAVFVVLKFKKIV